jgi:drug/metabolite transporter (DMT)-like permease
MKLIDVGMIVATTISWAFWPIAMKRALIASSPIAVTLLVGVSGAFFLPTLYFIAVKNHVQLNFSLNAFWWAAGAYAVNMIAQLALNKAMVTVPVNVAVSLTSCYPMLTFLFCYMFLHETITLMKVIGMLSIILGTVFIAL